MAVTETWKKLTTEAVLKGVGAPFSATFVGLGTDSFGIGVGDVATGEVIGTGYERVPVQWTDFVADMTNSNLLLWSAGGSWGSVNHIFVSDSSQGGAVLLWASFGAKTIGSGGTVKVEIGNLTLT